MSYSLGSAAMVLLAMQAAPVAQAPAPTEDPLVTALARKVYAQMRAGKVDDALLTPEMRQTLTPAALAQQKPVLDQLGEPTKLTLESMVKAPGGTSWVYLAEFAQAQLHVTIFVTSDGRVGGYELKL